MDFDVTNDVIFIAYLSWKLIICLLGCKYEKIKLSKQIIRQKMIFSKEIIFLRGERIGNFHSCEVFDVFELFEVGGGIKYA